VSLIIAQIVKIVSLSDQVIESSFIFVLSILSDFHLQSRIKPEKLLTQTKSVWWHWTLIMSDRPRSAPHQHQSQ